MALSPSFVPSSFLPLFHAPRPAFSGCLAGQAQPGGCGSRMAPKGKGKRAEEDGDRGKAAQKPAGAGGFQGTHAGRSGAAGPR